MDWKLEVVPVPVSDIDKALAFYRDQFGFAVDLDDQVSEDERLVQLTPPGSGCSIQLKTTEMPPGSLRGLQIVVDDVAAARAELLDRGADISGVRHFEAGAWVDGPGGRWNSFAFLSDPDGNTWVLQERG
ncbi:MAG TPA: VOC family protein [Acidimicrobiia bacterium]|nr:VOC family protein [Acidimicrobiia bacterium]